MGPAAQSSSGLLAAHDLGGEGPPLVLAHATGFHAHVWEPLAKHLHGFRVVAVDMPGHGDSTVGDGEMLWADAAHRLLATLDDLGVVRPVGVGHSMGGSVLLLAEEERPDTFASLYLYEPVVFPTDLGLGPDDNPLAAGALRRRRTFASRQAALDNYASKPPLDVLDPEVLRAYVDHGFSADPLEEAGVTLRCEPEVESQTYRMGLTHDAYDRLGDVRCPVVVARGRTEPLSPSLVARRLVGQLPDARLEVFDDLGHFGPLEQPGKIAEAVVRAFPLGVTGGT